MRNKNKKVYFVPVGSNNEYLLYAFDAQKGDQLSNVWGGGRAEIYKNSFGDKNNCYFVWKGYFMKRGDIYYADLRPVIGSEQGGIRPVLIIQNDVGNRHSPTVICAAITSKMNKAKLPTHIELSALTYDMDKDSVVLLEQLRTIDKKRLKDKVCHLDDDILMKVNMALNISLELCT